MGRCRVVLPDKVRLPLSDGDWIDVWKELNAGEYFDLIRDLVDRKPFAKVLAYVTAWSLIGLDDQPLPWAPDVPEDLKRDTIRNLDKGTVRELIAVLDRHEETSDKARDERKKKTAGTPLSVPTSPSPDTSTGPSTTSVN